jgi:iron complex transport system permease protein
MNTKNYKTRLFSPYLLIIAAPLVFLFASLFIGRYPLSVFDIKDVLISFFSGSNTNITHNNIIQYIRLPRAILGILVGGSLAISGAAFQGLFRNPLVSSGMLGVSAGAGFGAALAIILFNGFFYVYFMSFAFGLLAVMLSFFVGRLCSASPTITLVLGGIIIGSIFSALTSFAKYVADPYDQLPTIIYWLMGSLSRARYKDIIMSGIPMIIGSAGLIIMRWRMNVLSMGDREAQTLGINVRVHRIFIIICATLATAGAVSVSGVIGWIGLVVPHMGRMITGSNNKLLIPVSFSVGACFLLVVDDISRVISGSEMPLGILTAIVGGPFFIYLLKKTKGREW